MTQSLVKFLLARITDDKARAKAAYPHGFGPTASREYNLPEITHQVILECDAKRRIVERWQLGEGDPEDHHPVPDEVLQLLALPYADHPGYREEWRP
jgi:hypothetical protein